MYLTFDAEVYIPLRGDSDYTVHQERVWTRVLDTLKANRVRTTHFVTGEFAQAFPDLVRRMVEDGHEIGSHTLSHAGFANQGFERFEREVNDSRTLLRDLTGTPVLGFRAPFGQVPPNLAAVLARAGYAYDSSLAATHIPHHFEALLSPKHPYRASSVQIRRGDPRGPILEMPVSVSPIVPLPYGGIFLSGLAPLVMRLPRSRRDPNIMFLHPYDFVDLAQFRGAYMWDKWKFTQNNWKLLQYWVTETAGADSRMCRLAQIGEESD